ncbi:MAG: 2-oxoacid:acceptor oxidoreductase family protein, partial [Hoeflea sp.]
MASRTKSALAARAHDPALDQVIKIAVMAVGGQGGGVLTNWIEDTAHRNGYAVQATSVAGVAQRTGATIYYIEMAPKGDRAPV